MSLLLSFCTAADEVIDCHKMAVVFFFAYSLVDLGAAGKMTVTIIQAGRKIHHRVASVYSSCFLRLALRTQRFMQIYGERHKRLTPKWFSLDCFLRFKNNFHATVLSKSDHLEAPKVI